MKKKKLYPVLFFLVASVMILGACASKKNTESQAPDAAVTTSLEAASTESTQKQTEEIKQETIAQVSLGAEESTVSSSQGDGPGFHMEETPNDLPEDKSPDPNAKKEVVIGVYQPSDGDKGIYMDFMSVVSLEPQAVVNKLVECGVLVENATVLTYEMNGGKATLNLVGIDLNNNRKAVCVANTFIENFNLDSITIIAGEETSKNTENMTFATNLKEIK